MKIKFAVSGLLSLVLLPASVQCFAQAATLSDCQSIQDRLARYACYDKWDSASGTVRQAAPAPRAATPRAPEPADDASEFGRASNRAAAPEAPPAAATASAAPATMDNFGRNQSNARLVDGEEGSELIDTVASLEQRGPNLWVVTLASGQRWQQMISKRYPLEVGEEVRIYPTRWGSAFRLSSERTGSFIQVQRIDHEGAAVAVVPRASPGAAPRVQQEEEGPGLLGRVGGAIGGVGSRIGGIFGGNDDEEDEEEVAPATGATASAPAAESAVASFGRAAATSDGAGARLVDGELIDTIASLKELGPNLLQVTLSSGQQWRQMISKRYPLEVGDEVRIYSTRWGSSFRLSAERVGSYIQVERVD